MSGLLRQLQRNKPKTKQDERGAVLRSSMNQGSGNPYSESDSSESIRLTAEPISFHHEPSWVRALTEELAAEPIVEKPKRPPTLHSTLRAQGAEFQDAPWWLRDTEEKNPQIEQLSRTAVEILSQLPELPHDLVHWRDTVNVAIEKASSALKDEVRISHRMLEQVEHELLELVTGKGPLEALFQDTLVSDIYVDHHGSIRVLRSGHAIETPLRFLSKEAYNLFIRAQLTLSRQQLSPANPVIDFVIADKWQTRVNLVHPIISGSEEAKICFRVPRHQAVSFFDIIQTKTLPATLAAWLAELVALGEANILVVGPELSGKTVLMTALLSAVGSDERIVAIEQFPEIFIPSGHFERLVALPTHHEPGGRGTLNDLLAVALRRSPHRVALSLLDANTSAAFLDTLEVGFSGSVASLLALDGEDGLWRFADYVAGIQMRTPFETIVRRISRAVQLIVTMRRDENGPCLYEIAEVLPSLETEFRLQPIVQYLGIQSGKRQWQLKVKHSRWLSRLKEQGLHLSPGPGLLGPVESRNEEELSIEEGEGSHE